MSAVTSRKRKMLIWPNPRLERIGSSSSATPVRAAAVRAGVGSVRRVVTMVRIAQIARIVASVHTTCTTGWLSTTRGVNLSLIHI